MFLIEYDKGLFIDGEEVNWVEIKNDSVRFTIKNEREYSVYSATEEYRDIFINNLEALNGNRGIESAWHKLKKTDAL